MKRLISIALVLLMLAAFAACGKKAESAQKTKDIKEGIWTATIDAKPLMEQELAGEEGIDELLENLKDCTLDIEIQFYDNDASIKFRTTEFIESLKNAFKAMMESKGMPLTDEQLKEFTNGFSKEIKADLQDIWEPYTVDGDKITIGDIIGTISKGTMKLDFLDFGTATFKQN